MKTLLKLSLGILIGLGASWLIIQQNGINWATAGLCLLGAILCFIVYAVMRSRKNRTVVNKVMACLLVSLFAVSPWTIAQADDTYAGYTGSSCYCLEPEPDIRAASGGEPDVENAVILNFVVDVPNGPIPLANDPTPRIVSVRRADPSTLVSWAEFAATFAAEGIDLNAANSTQYAKNGRPVSASEVPFMLNQSFSEKFTLYPDQPQYRVVVETTSDLSGEFAWQAVARFSIPANTAIQYQDTPDGKHAFYRVRMETTQPGPIQPAAGAIVLGCGLGLLVGVGYVAVATVRACAKNKKKFDKMKTNSEPSQIQFNLAPAH